MTYKFNMNAVPKDKISQHVNRHMELMSKSKLYETDQRNSIANPDGLPILFVSD